MAVESPGAFNQGGSYGAEQTRRAIGSDLARGATIGSILGGIVGAGDCLVTAGTGMHVLVAPGELWVPGTSSATQSGYYSRVSSSTELAIATSDPSNPRIDRISAIIKDKAYSGAEDTFSVAVETGTPTAGATLENLNGEAAAPASSLTLAHVLVPAASGSVTNGNIKNVATLAVPGLSTATYREGTAAERPAAGAKGRIWYATDTKVYSIDTGSAWQALTGGLAVNGNAAVSPALGEFLELTNAAPTVTLPAPSLGAVVGLFAAGGTVTIKQHAAEKIYGDFVNAANEIKLTLYQHVVLQGDTNGNWIIIAGEPKREQTYSEEEVANNSEHIASETRPAFVSVKVEVKTASAGTMIGELRVGGKLVQSGGQPGAAGTSFSLCAIVPPGVKWKIGSTLSGGETVLHATTILL